MRTSARGLAAGRAVHVRRDGVFPTFNGIFVRMASATHADVRNGRTGNIHLVALDRIAIKGPRRKPLIEEA